MKEHPFSFFSGVYYVQEGFWFHHAEPKYLMLVYWIPTSAHTIPANATHRVGIGAVVMNEKKEVRYYYLFLLEESLVIMS